MADTSSADQDQKNPNQQASDESSFGHRLGEPRGQQGTPLAGELPEEATNDPRYTGEGRLRIDQDNAIPGQKRARHNSGSRSGQR
jgi:hypothetical protein